VRANGSKTQYLQFTQEYFPGLVAEIVDVAPMRTVLNASDLFVSIYSQTLFEASCMGIPVIYYRVGDVFKYPPFDGQAELVTVDTVSGLEEALEDFRVGSDRFAPFLDRAVMSQYVGPLDGRNLERNLQHVYDMLAERAGGRTP
jgi:CDP-glycerol glycerophosphotransferase (TagB/SpsB family)